MTNAAAGYIDHSLGRGGSYDNDSSSSSLQKLQVTPLSPLALFSPLSMFQSRIVSYEQEIEKWKSAYEKMVHENEQLRTRGETQLAAQWRDRYENCCQEKEELVEEIKMLQACSRSSTADVEGMTSPSANHMTGHLMSSNDSFSLERAYMQLKEEYKVSPSLPILFLPRSLLVSVSVGQLTVS
jgi:regulator of replication initiation timing